MDKKIKVRVRLVIIKNGKILLSYVKDEDFYFYIGGKMEFGETVEQTCQREVAEECDAKFTFKKILYVRDYLKPDENEHSLELFILGDIDKFAELEHYPDRECPENHFQAWIGLKDLSKTNVKPKNLTPQILKDFADGFKDGAIYLKELE
jgi:ADP-ribose pyrophosphatase YjhB (NUDIX family)